MESDNSRLFVIRGVPLNQDSRTRRHLKFDFIEKRAITWEDEGPRWLFFHTGRLQYPTPVSYLIWLTRLFIMSLTTFRRGDTVICMDLDTYIPVRLGSIFCRAKIYFDIVDPISQTRFRRIPFSTFFDWFEFFLLRFSRRVIVPGEKRVCYYFDRLGLSRQKLVRVPQPTVIENVATFSKTDREKSIVERTNRKIVSTKTIAYFGSLSESRGLREMCEYFADRPHINVLIAGRGASECAIQELADKHSNINYSGSFDYSELAEMLAGVDFYWAYYSPSVLLHKYAYPNKYYEHLAFRVPIILNECVPQSSKVSVLKTGIVIDDQLSEATFRGLERKIFLFDDKKADFFEWERRYEDYIFRLGR
jgi:hypothetical protein